MKQIKQKLSLLLTTSNLLGASFLTTNTKINGFHITVKASNINLVNSINHWNNDSNYLNENIASNPLNINFDSYDQIINNDWNLATNANNIINKQGYLQAQQRITNNISNFKNSTGFANTNLTAFGHTFNSKNQSIIIPYHETINESINQGLFEVINEKSKLNTLMEVPYILTPSTTFQNNDISMRAKTFPIGPVNNGEDTISNQLFVFYVHAFFLKNNKGLNITVAGQPSITIKTNASNTFSYAILNQQYDANNTPTNYDIQWKDNDNSTILQEEKVKVISSTPTVNIGNNNEYINNSSLIHQYFVKNNSSGIAVKALSQIKNQVPISFNENEQWTYQAVSDNLTPVAKTNTLNNNSTLKPRDGADHTIYLLQRTTSDNKIDPESQQYLNVYTINPLLLTINGYSDFATSNLGHAFAQYLREATNVDEIINKLNAGQLRYWLLFYAHDLTNHLYVNINNHDDKILQKCKKQVLQTEDNLWSLKQQPLTLITIINNWNVIIIGGIILLVIVTVPVIVLIIRRKKIK